MIEGYCVKCKAKVEIIKPTLTKTKKGIPLTKGKCGICNTTVCKLGGNDDRA